MLESFFKTNKKEYRKFKAFLKGDTPKEDEPVVGKKRKRADSNVSELASAGAIKRRRASSIVSEASEKPAAEKKERKPLEYKFARIDPSKFEGKIRAEFMDNTFEAKEKFGKGGDSYGAWSSNKLKVVVGKGFVKEKNKMKNR